METLQHLLDGSTTPLWSALRRGRRPAVSPCPLATNIAAVGYIGHNAENRHRVFLAGLCYTLGRILACTALGIALIPLLRRGASLFAVERLLARYGEVLLPATLLLFGVLLLFGDRLSLPLRGGSGRKVLRCNGCGGALLLGILFSLTFCPTSALLYFGMLLPMAAAEPAGWMLPALYAAAAGLPVAAAAWILAYGASGIGTFYNRMQSLQRGLTRLVGGGMILAGIYYTATGIL